MENVRGKNIRSKMSEVKVSKLENARGIIKVLEVNMSEVIMSERKKTCQRKMPEVKLPKVSPRHFLFKEIIGTEFSVLIKSKGSIP